MEQPLSGIIVIDMSRALAGPHAGMMLADLGATVIKVERPETGDDTRGWGPPFLPDAEGDAQATYFLSCNRNKQSITLDLAAASGRSILERLVARADVVIENFRVGVMDRLGFSEAALRELNPRLVQLSISGFGHDGPDAQRAGYDQIVQGEAGLMSLTGERGGEPQRVGVPIADLLAGIHGVVGVVSALYERTITGVGKVVKTSLLASVVGVHSFQGARQTAAGDTPVALGNHHPSIAPYGLFTTGGGGSVQMSVGNDSLWSKFCTAFDLDPTTAGLATNAERVSNHDASVRFVEDSFAQLDSEEVLARLKAAGVPAGVVRNLREVYEWDQVASQHLLIDVQHPTLGAVTLPGSPLRFFDVREGELAESTRRAHTPPPLLDEHRDVILSWLGDDRDTER